MAIGTTPNATESSLSDEYTRLHITPLDPELLKVVIPSAVLPKARNISYHTIETFPENCYGFVDLPKMDAEKLKKKLNGSILKGTKVRVDEAKPEAINEPAAEDDTGSTKKSKKAKEKGERTKKRKRGSDAIEGVELEDRKVKRGWTVTESEMIKEKKSKKDKEKKSKDKKVKKDKKEKSKTKSKYTDGPECLFKQKLPEVPEATKDDDADGSKRKLRKRDREVVIHEFEKTLKYPTFLRSNAESSKSPPLVFEDGKGWVDGNGNVVEPSKGKRPPPSAKSAPSQQKSPKPTVTRDDDDTTSSSGSSSEDEDDTEDESSDEDMESGVTPQKQNLGTKPTSTPISILKKESSRPRSSGSTTSLTIKIPPVTPGSAKVHPLEALYKRSEDAESTPHGGGAESQPFSFFDNDDIEEDEDQSLKPRSQAPMTPFTREDFEFRNIRSAAPTPDTAHPSRTFNLWPMQKSSEATVPEEDEDDEMEDAEMQGEASGSKAEEAESEDDAKTAKPETSEEQKWFWDNRGDLNRAWRKRRRTAGKEKRNRINRARSGRAG